MHGQEKAPKELIEYEYRRTFGLSYEEMQNEPLDLFFVNSFIMSTITKIEKEEIDKTKRKLKHG